MTLDLVTSTFMTALVASVASLTFIIDTVLRRDTGPGRLWAVAFFCGLATTVAYASWSAGVGGVAIGVGNVTFILVPAFLWLGARRFNDRKNILSAAIVVAAAVATFSAVMIEGAGPGGWGGWPTMAFCLVAFFIAGAVESLRSPMRRIRTAWALSAVLLVTAFFYGARLVVFVTAGPDSDLFTTWFGTIVANMVSVMLTMVAAIVTSVLRSNRTTEQRYEWLTEGGVAADGVMLERTFAGAAADMAERASWRSEGVAVIVIRIEGVDGIRTAFGSGAADDISAVCRQAVRRYAPAAAIVGEDGEDELAVCAVAPTSADARRLGAMIYRGCMEELSLAASGLFPSVGVGVAVAEDAGYDLARLQRGARDAARRAADTPGASVVLDTPSPSAS